MEQNGAKGSRKQKITLVDYDESNFQEKEITNVEECFPFKDKPTITWINVDGLHPPEIPEKIGNYFGLHPLILEDILNTDQRPKIEDFDEHLFVVLKMLYFDKEKDEVFSEQFSEQISFILSSNFVISFQEKGSKVFENIRDRIKNSKGKIRKKGPDYLIYALIDAIVDSYFKILEKFGEKIEFLEEELVEDPNPETLQTIHELKRELISLRKTIWPLREIIGGLSRGETPLIKESTEIYFKDIYDHTIQIIDTIETYREMVSSMLDVYLSSVSNKMNEVMKVLTIIATIFIPLTFIAGLYGMNFAFMPELEWTMGYPIVLLIMVTVAGLMVIYFRRKEWL
ncbi:magnesium transporter [candidate division MSBL1 archaeon SCGC-AAA382A03]|uniref:Magnesium transport protein CorA n=1 Tax=candidate division MSBL1 archaeon SCGC-AAA382A03 TaxID=1698278 RepID=A0A133VC34_9EURY|nr:magnesium transporter [candidate division MSBL1 archaeon SCGC-AAA382A03]